MTLCTSRLKLHNDIRGGSSLPYFDIWSSKIGGVMNYAVPTDRVFATGSAVKTKVRLPKEAQSIRKFCATHAVSVQDDPQTGKVVVRVEEVEPTMA